MFVNFDVAAGSTLRQRHYAVVMKRGKVLAEAANVYGNRSKGCGYGEWSLHAERAAVKRLGDTSQLRGAYICVWRVSNVSYLPSKPCEECAVFLKKCMRVYGLRAVYYQNAVAPL